MNPLTRGSEPVKRQVRGLSLLTLTAFIWGTAFVAQRKGMDHIGPVTFLAVRFLIATVSLLPVICAKSLLSRNTENRGLPGPASMRQFIKGGAYCGVVLFACGMFQQIGIMYTTVGKSGFLTTLYIVTVPILGLALGQRMKLHAWCCVFTAIAGMYLLCVNESVVLNKGDVLTLFCAVFYAVHILLVDHYSPRTDGVKLSCMQFFVCGILGLAAAFIFENPELPAIFSAWASLLYTGVLSSGVAYTLQILGQRDVNPVAASLVMSLEAVFAVLTGWMILGETLTGREIFGCALIFSANVVVQLLGTTDKIKGNAG
jgi:drug/metabolite transporter (DMT)-like permease